MKQQIENGCRALGICLGHQALALHLGFDIVGKQTCTQGVQAPVPIFGAQELCGFYNSFEAVKDGVLCQVLEQQNTIGFQFHPESVMTQNGYNILATAIKKLFIMTP